MLQPQGNGCRCACKCALGYEEYRHSVVENSCWCRSCCQLDGQSDNEETLPKQPDSSSADEHETKGNISLTDRSLSESTLYMHTLSQDNLSRRSKSNIFRNPGSMSSEEESYRRLRLFCTCSLESSCYLREVVKMLKTLKNSGFEVRTDRYRNNPNVRDMSIAANIQDWLDESIARADFVIVCISPKYLVDIKAPTDNVPEADANALFTRYIYDQLRAEYYFNRCCHQKVIPVRFHDTYVPNIKIPSFMKTTIVYTYPNDLNDLISFLNMNKNRSRLQPLM
ncbi:hypothetical protein CHS0354_020130 [Potamilus streckersoni]|uniref:SEFIR domain-containing protein n=1 Tax=Potamilus streckersoni TaxID=2493646 RepID=A0AAE0S5I6_9BIVA|nr:hypothetical protein CHS0354_020130 [Potamilus streckersoni]